VHGERDPSLTLRITCTIRSFKPVAQDDIPNVPSGQAELARLDDDLRAITRAQLGEDMIDMRLYGCLADKELRRDLRVAVPLRNQAHDLQLARGQPELRYLGCYGCLRRWPARSWAALDACKSTCPRATARTALHSSSALQSLSR
jgi:hypothetical protein